MNRNSNSIDGNFHPRFTVTRNVADEEVLSLNKFDLILPCKIHFRPFWSGATTIPSPVYRHHIMNSRAIVEHCIHTQKCFKNQQKITKKKKNMQKSCRCFMFETCLWKVGNEPSVSPALKRLPLGQLTVLKVQPLAPPTV
ncbi:hypothetical protein V8G54_003173 [Vigna mungo]|uniref:Uncharacterized protein n=1 Tax=Vigna mungo TaxID=3915 RepID=A0AAQ3PBR9_VIGMU